MAKSPKTSGKKRKKKSGGAKAQILILFILLAGLSAMPTTVMLMLGMLPTIVCMFADRTKEKTRALTVGAMNVAGCAPFIIELWSKGHQMETTMAIIADPRTIIVMYCAAGVGYVIDWTVSGLVAGVMASRGEGRRKQIESQQEALIARWGKEVTGDYPVDSDGFLALDEDEQMFDRHSAPAGGARR